MKKKIRFAILGAGVIAPSHADAVRSLSDAALVGVADKSPERAKAFADRYGIRAYLSPDELFADPEVDVISICTPSGLHKEQAIAAMEHGKHVLIEKPIALCGADADCIIEASERTGMLASSVFQMRTEAGVRRVRQLIEEGAFGKITSCSLLMNFWRDDAYYAAGSWRGTWKYDGGGALMNQGIHGIDLLICLLGMPHVEAAQVRTALHRIETEDLAAALLSFPCGAVGTVLATTCAYPGFARQLEISGDRGHAILQEGTLEKLIVNGKEVDLSDSDTPEEPEYLRHADQMRNLIDAIRGQASLLLDAAEGAKAVRVIEEIYRLGGIR